METIAAFHPERKETLYFMLEKVGSGFHVMECVRVDGWSAVSFSKPPQPMNCTFSQLKTWLKTQLGLAMAFVCDIEDGGRYVQVFFTEWNGKVPKSRADIQGSFYPHPSLYWELCGTYFPNKRWTNEISKEEYDKAS